MGTRTASRRAPDWTRGYGVRELWSQVAPGLWVGGTSDRDHVGIARHCLSPNDRAGYFAVTENAAIGPSQFDAVVTMYAWARPVDWGVQELRWGIEDSAAARLDPETLRETVVWAHRRWAAGQKVLCRCQAGINRSALVAGLVLVRSGLDGPEAIAMMREARSPQVLKNVKFEAIVRLASEDRRYGRDFWREGI